MQPAPTSSVLRTAHEEPTDNSAGETESTPSEVLIAFEEESAETELARLESMALTQNPDLLRLNREYQAAVARANHIGALPDPSVGTNVFGHPIETAAGSQRANLSVQQMIPWLERLDAQEQQACLEASAALQRVRAQELRVRADLRAGYFRLYALRKESEALTASKVLLETLIELTTARIPDGKATRGDVLLGTVELGRLEEQRVSVQQRQRSTAAELNRLTGRDPNTPVTVVAELDVARVDLSHEELFASCRRSQPELMAANLMVQAARLGIDVAELRRRPDVSLGAAWYFIDDNRATPSRVDVGRDAWSLGASITIPLEASKYDAILNEAQWKHSSAHAALESLTQRYSARLVDLIEQAQAAAKTANLYETTIVPQAQDALEADQENLGTGAVTFERVIQDVRNLLTLEVAYHKALAEHATALARIRQTQGLD